MSASFLQPCRRSACRRRSSSCSLHRRLRVRSLPARPTVGGSEKFESELRSSPSSSLVPESAPLSYPVCFSAKALRLSCNPHQRSSTRKKAAMQHQSKISFCTGHRCRRAHANKVVFSSRLGSLWMKEPSAALASLGLLKLPTAVPHRLRPVDSRVVLVVWPLAVDTPRQHCSAPGDRLAFLLRRIDTGRVLVASDLEPGADTTPSACCYDAFRCDGKEQVVTPRAARRTDTLAGTKLVFGLGMPGDSLVGTA
eukprot:3688875-Rhodomonas_salina.3